MVITIVRTLLSGDSAQKFDPITIPENYELVGGIIWLALDTTETVLNHIDFAAKGVNFSVIQSVMAKKHITKNDMKGLVHHLMLWAIGKDEQGCWLFEINSENIIHYSILTECIGKRLSAVD